MLLMDAKETFEDVIADAIERAGGIRPLTRVLMRGGLRMHGSQVINLRDGLARPNVAVPNALVGTWPDIAARMYTAMGVVITGQETGLEADVERIAEERGIPAHEVLSTLVDEEIRRLSKK